MRYKQKKYTTSYKYFSNEQIAFVTSAKVGSRFMKSVSDNLQFSNYTNPLDKKLEEVEFNHIPFPKREDFTTYAVDNFYKQKETVFLIRNPLKRFISGLTTNLSIINTRCFRDGEDGTDFMRHYFDNFIDSESYIRGVDKVKDLVKEFLFSKNKELIKEFIITYILPESIYKDSHVEFHHFMAYNYMNDLKNAGVNLKYLDIIDLDNYFKTKEITYWGYNENMDDFKQTERDTIFYKYISDNLEIWKSEIKELSLYLEIETEYYDKIKKEYEILL